MKRKILTFKNGSGETEDLIPYVDGYGVTIGGTNLVDYLNQIETTFSKALLFLGAFATETALLTAYPNGSDLEDGTYAIVADTDTLYIYDTEGEEWLPTASNISGIMELNGLTPVSGALTITGGDINSTVSSADTQTQTITAHLNELYEENDSQNTLIASIKTAPIGFLYANSSSISDSVLTYTGTIENTYYNKRYAIVQFKKDSNATGNEYVNLTVSDGTNSKTYTLRYSSSNNRIKYKSLYAKLGLDNSSNSADCLVIFDNTNNYAFINNFEGLVSQKIKTFNISTWSSSQAGGYYTGITLANLPIKPNYRVLSISKVVDSVTTTAIVDYRIFTYDNTADMLRIYSDETFTGTVTVLYDYE